MIFFKKLFKKIFELENRLTLLEHNPPLIPRINHYNKELDNINDHIKALSEKLTNDIQYCLQTLNDFEKIIEFVHSLARDTSSSNEATVRRLLNEIGIDLFKQNRELYKKYTGVLKIKWEIEKENAIAKINLEKFYLVSRPSSLLNKTAKELFEMREELKNNAIIYEREEKYSECEQANNLLRHLEDL